MLFRSPGWFDRCATSNIPRPKVRSDSELLVRQMQGRYKVKSESLKRLHERAIQQSRGRSHPDPPRHRPPQRTKQSAPATKMALYIPSSPSIFPKARK